jgi:hypothetical protein
MAEDDDSDADFTPKPGIEDEDDDVLCVSDLKPAAKSQPSKSGSKPAPKQSKSAPSASVRKQLPKKRPPKKKKDAELYAHFTIVQLSNGNVSVTCNHCPHYTKPSVQKFNPTKGRIHLTGQCRGIGIDTKRALLRGTQRNRRNGDMYAIASEGTVDEMRDNALHSPPSIPRNGSLSSVSTLTPPSVATNDVEYVETMPNKRRAVGTGKQPTRHQRIDSHAMLGPAMSRAEAEKIITRKVKSMLARGEPLDRLLDDYVRAEMIGDYPAIAHYLPNDEETIYNNYAIPIDLETTEELQKFIYKLPGYINMSMDGATINGKQKVSLILPVM